MIDFLTGAVTGVFTLLVIQHALAIARENKTVDELLEEHGTEEWALQRFSDILLYDCPEGHADSGELCNTSPNGLWVCLERIKYAQEMEEPLYDFELSHNETPDEPGVWAEVEIQNDCGYGCKIYEHMRTGRRALMHNSAYGCRK